MEVVKEDLLGFVLLVLLHEDPAYVLLVELEEGLCGLGLLALVLILQVVHCGEVFCY
jgi:hypothetical protein